MHHLKLEFSIESLLFMSEFFQFENFLYKNKSDLFIQSNMKLNDCIPLSYC